MKVNNIISTPYTAKYREAWFCVSLLVNSLQNLIGEEGMFKIEYFRKVKFMKNLFLIVICLFSFGCTNVQQEEVSSEKRTPVVKTIEENYLVDVKIIKTGATSIRLKVENKSEDYVEIIWDSSTIGTSKVFIAGQKFTDAGNPVPNSIIPPHTAVESTIWPVDEIYYYRGWEHDEMSYPTKLVIKFKQDQEEVSTILELDVNR